MDTYKAAIRYKEWVHYVELKDISELHNLIIAFSTWGEVTTEEFNNTTVYYLNDKPIALIERSLSNE